LVGADTDSEEEVITEVPVDKINPFESHFVTLLDNVQIVEK
jgi:hypothetical protein